MSHIPVLLQPTIEGLQIKEGEIVVDATLGLGGHSREICQKIGKTGTLIGIDQDSSTLAKAKEYLSIYPANKIFKLSNFRHLAEILDQAGIEQVDTVLFDLGFSSEQMDLSGRGFTFQKDEPLLMTLASDIDQNSLTAEEIVNNWEEDNLADIIYGYGEEKFARRIAKVIFEARKEKPIRTTYDLVELIRQAVPTWYTKRRIHFATKTFQALRITVNDELGAFKEGLAGAWDRLDDEGRIAVISFHSLEAKLVKDFIKEKKKNKELELITKVVKPTREELLNNPRSRSAQLRIFKKICLP